MTAIATDFGFVSPGVLADFAAILVAGGYMALA